MATRTKVIIGVLVVGLLAIGGGLYFFYFGDDEPPVASVDNALGGSASGGSTTTAVTDGATTDGVDGAWTVDTSTGDFDFESATGTFAGFRIQENLAGIGATEAVGRTGDVTGTMTIEGTTVSEASFEVDVSTITSNDQRRNACRRQYRSQHGNSPVVAERARVMRARRNNAVGGPRLHSGRSRLLWVTLRQPVRCP